MNKQDKLDEMVKKYSGTFPTFEELRADDDVGGYSLTGNNVPTDVTYRREVFSKEQFQQRARELGYGVEAAEHESWYCYETQKAMRLPPVGVECLTWFDDGKECWQKCKVLALSPYEQDHMAVSLIGRYDRKLIWSQDFKPLDWNRKKYEAIEAASKCFQAHCMHDYIGQPFLDGLAGLYDAGFLRMPEEK